VTGLMRYMVNHGVCEDMGLGRTDSRGDLSPKFCAK
jgi:hypothetical protein